MSTLRARLDALAANFARELVASIQSSSLQDLLGAPGGTAGAGRAPSPTKGKALSVPPAQLPIPFNKKPGRLPRRSAEEIQAALGKIVLLVKTQKGGLRAEEIRAKLGMEAKEMPRILKEGVATKKLVAKGQKRATTYSVR